MPISTQAVILRAMKHDTSRALSRILASSSDQALVADVRALPARALTTIIDRVGLEDASELVALATSEQLASVLDDDLWKSIAPGEDESFDDARFALWLEILGEAGDERVARTLNELPEELLVLGLSRRLLVFDVDALAVTADHRTDHALEAALSLELDSWLLVAREHDGWDALVAALLALDREHHDQVQRVLTRVAAATEHAVDDAEGLHHVLTAAESIAEDAAADREERRAKEGYLAPSSARAFLELAEQSSLAELRRMTSDTVTKGYFRNLEKARVPDVTMPSRLRELLPERRAFPRARKPTAFGKALEQLAPDAHTRALEELAYLTNVLVAARGLRPFDAAARVMEVCDAGYAKAEDFDVVRFFRVGWHRSAE